MKFFINTINWTKRKLWALIVAYMLGLHNFYNGDNKTPDNAASTIEHKHVQEDDTGHD